MHPEMIKAHLRIGGVTPAALADELGVCRMVVSSVIHGRGTSKRVAERIAQLLGKPLGEIWPEKYGAKKKASLQRRLHDREAA